jgi:hypothetical protein
MEPSGRNWWQSVAGGVELNSVSPAARSAGDVACSPRRQDFVAHSWPKRRLDDWLNHAVRWTPRQRKVPANEAVQRRSSPGVVVPDSACHAGGRGFESRRSRLLKCLQTGIFRLLVRRGTRAIGQQTGSTSTRGRRLVAHKLPANELVLSIGMRRVRSGTGRGAIAASVQTTNDLRSGQAHLPVRCWEATKKASPCVSTSTPAWALNTLRRISRCSAVASA